ncbi:MAG: hypothetical protein M1812_000302 [Candelaria pacifica]|nr:MAG: hypothetical protein M1812_000302 [Candelaria pacifica]
MNAPIPCGNKLKALSSLGREKAASEMTNAAMDLKKIAPRSLPAPMVQSHAPTTSSSSGGLSPSAIIGIAVAGSVVLIIALSVIFILCHNARQRKASACSERQNSMSQPDHGAIEKPRRVLRRSKRGVERPPNGWASIGSTADLHQRPQAGELSRSGMPEQIEQAGHGRRSSRVSWPLRRYPSLRATRSLAQLQDSPLSAIAESPILLYRISPNVHGRVELPAESLSISRQPTIPLANSPPTEHLDDPYVDRSSPKNLVPQPLFAGSVKKDITESRIQHSKSERCRPLSGMKPSLDLADSSRSIRARVYSRAASLSHETSGTAPEMPMPSLPPGAVLFDQGGRRVTSAQRRPSTISSSSGGSTSSSLLRLKGSTPNPQLATQLATSDPAPSTNPPGQPRGLGIFDAGLEHFPKTSISNVPLRHPTVRRLQSSQISHDSISSMSSLDYRAIQNRKSWNTGRISLDGISGEEKRMSLKRLSQVSVHTIGDVPPASKVPIPSTRPSCARTISFIGVSPEHEDCKNDTFPCNQVTKQTPNSILQDVSGNGLGPLRSRSSPKHPAAVERNPFGWNSTMSQKITKPSAMKNSPNAKKKGHKRQNCVRISTKATVFGAYSCPPTIEESEIPSTPTRIPVRRENTLLLKTQDLRPPPHFFSDPQLPAPALAKPTTKKPLAREESQLSPTLSMIRYYGSNRSLSPAREDFASFSSRLSKHHSGSSVFSTPTRPSSIQITPKEMTFSFVAQDATPPHVPKRLKEPTPPLGPGSSSMFAPPKMDIMATAPAWKRTGGTIRGPRSQPARGIHRGRSPSPRDLRKSVALLRRMNSEISDLSMRRTERYPNIDAAVEEFGSPGPSILESDVDSTDGGSPKPPRKVPKIEPRKEKGMRDAISGVNSSPGQRSLYDQDGFLKA